MLCGNEEHCYFRAVYNMGRGQLCKSVRGSVRLAVGSLGLCGGSDGVWWEFGGNSGGDACARDTPEFLSGAGISLTRWNWHVWLEDAEGRVYDELSHLDGICAVHGKRVSSELPVRGE